MEKREDLSSREMRVACCGFGARGGCRQVAAVQLSGLQTPPSPWEQHPRSYWNFSTLSFTGNRFFQGLRAGVRDFGRKGSSRSTETSMANFII